MSVIRFDCDRCGHMVSAYEDEMGKLVRCAFCRRRVEVPYQDNKWGGDLPTWIIAGGVTVIAAILVLVFLWCAGAMIRLQNIRERNSDPFGTRPIPVKVVHNDMQHM